MIRFTKFAAITEQVSSVDKKTFLRYMSIAYEKGDERLIKKYLDSATELQVSDLVSSTFKQKLPRAERGSSKTLMNKIMELGVSSKDKVQLAGAIQDGSAYDILKMLNKSVKSPVSISSCVNSSIAGAEELLPWYVGWVAKPDSGTRGKASTEIWLISAGKNGRTPDKGDAIVDGVAVESKSARDSFSSEFSISGKQSSFKEPTARFKSGISELYKKKKIKVDESQHGLGSAKKSGAISGVSGKSLSTALNNTAEALSSAGMNARSINLEINRLVNDAFPSARGISFNVMDGKGIDANKFMTLWNACAFAEYKSEEGFDIMSMFNRKSFSVVSFKTPKDILDSHDRLKHNTISYEVGIGQNKSLGGFGFK